MLVFRGRGDEDQLIRMASNLAITRTENPCVGGSIPSLATIFRTSVLAKYTLTEALVRVQFNAHAAELSAAAAKRPLPLLESAVFAARESRRTRPDPARRGSLSRMRRQTRRSRECRDITCQYLALDGWLARRMKGDAASMPAAHLNRASTEPASLVSGWGTACAASASTPRRSSRARRVSELFPKPYAATRPRRLAVPGTSAAQASHFPEMRRRPEVQA